MKESKGELESRLAEYNKMGIIVRAVNIYGGRNVIIAIPVAVLRTYGTSKLLEKIAKDCLDTQSFSSILLQVQTHAAMEVYNVSDVFDEQGGKIVVKADFQEKMIDEKVRYIEVVIAVPHPVKEPMDDFDEEDLDGI